MRKKPPYLQYLPYLVIAFPALAALWVWLSPLAFVPVPWPDDSAFYFVAKYLFQWPPRWVMIPQSPFEPTYRIFNFNTMPLYPFLIGLGRLIGIDGSFALKLWPLGFWAASGMLFIAALKRAGLPLWILGILALGFGMDPTLRWASVLIRPESLIGLCGMALVLGITLGYPRRFLERGWWNPTSALLAAAAYSHFNAIHLLFPVVLGNLKKPSRLIRIAFFSVIYLSPWLLTVVARLDLFTHQMGTQWKRLQVGNDWLQTSESALRSLFQGMGSPEPWPEVLIWTSYGLWFLIGTAFLVLAIHLFRPVAEWLMDLFSDRDGHRIPTHGPSLLPAAGWVIGSIWLWNSKPEVWFTYYIHAALWCFSGLLALYLWRAQLRQKPTHPAKRFATTGLVAHASLLAFIAAIFTFTNLWQEKRLEASTSWRWDTYYSFVDCVDHRLIELEHKLAAKGTSHDPFRVWGPTFPDILIELNRRHPNWEFTRTNDFYDRNDAAVQHGNEVEAVVVTETVNFAERVITGPASEHPEVQSIWMTWKAHYLNRLWVQPGWKPNRFICQRGRWVGFLYMKDE